MDILNVNFDKYIPDITNTLIEIFGEEYKDVITDRVKKTSYIMYNNPEGIRDYYKFLIECKNKELALVFLKKIGFDIRNYDIKNYLSLNEDITKLIDGYIGSMGFSKNNRNGICSFRYNDIPAINNQINFINFLCSSHLTFENYNEFKKNNEFFQILNNVKDYLKIFDNLSAVFEEYKLSLNKYEDYISINLDKKKKILFNKKKEFYDAITPHIPKNILDVISKTLNGDIKLLFECNDLDKKTYIEYFSLEDNKKLVNPIVDENEKRYIRYSRLMYLKSLNINIESYMKKYDYDSLFNLREIQDLIPSELFICIVKKFRKEKYEEAMHEFVCTSDSYNNIKKFQDKKIDENVLSLILEKNYTCTSHTAIISNEFNPAIFYTIREGDFGSLDFIFLHELIHAISSDNKGRTGFEILNMGKYNKYDYRKRKYERINETLTDMLAIEARYNLHKKGIFFAEPKEHITNNVFSKNTDVILKEMLYPLLKKYRPQIIKSFIMGDLLELSNFIGEENFERLNDLVNMVDYLLSQGLCLQTRNNDLINLYKIQLNNLEKVYTDIDNYVKNNSFQKKRRFN